MLHKSIFELREVFKTYVRKEAPHIDAFCGAALWDNHGEEDIGIASLPMQAELPAMKKLAMECTSSLVEAVLDASRHVHWRQSYTIEDEGIDQNHLDHYGWFNLIAPSGPFVSKEMRLSICYWGQGLHYPRHWHEPEEIYLTLAGKATYHSEGRASVEGGPGASVCNYSNQPHGADFSKSPAIVAAFWRGNNLEKRSVIENVKMA
ncbi:MAG: dimethylsulfonioproprionate lyase family protein [Pseudomonadota bacterium]